MRGIAAIELFSGPGATGSSGRSQEMSTEEAPKVPNDQLILRGADRPLPSECHGGPESHDKPSAA
jgi:hypothetical protein